MISCKSNEGSDITGDLIFFFGLSLLFLTKMQSPFLFLATLYTFEVTSDSDLNVKVVKSGSATLKIPHIINVEPGPASEGYITNVEGVIERVRKMIESAAECEDDPAAKKKAKNMLKKLGKVLVGREKLKIILEDPDGHSVIISDKAVKSKL